MLMWLLCGIILLVGQAWAVQPAAPAQGFTPEAGITISFPKSTFNSGEATTAYITISGRTDGATIIASVSGPGVAQSTVNVSSGSGSVAVTVPTTAGDYTYGASATIAGTGVSDTTTVTVTSNRPPVAFNGTATTDEDTSCQLTFSATDPDGDPLIFIPSSPYTYTPPQDFNGEDTVTFSVSDGRGGTATGSITITVNPVNDAPEAYGGEIETDEDVPVEITLFGFDIDGDDLTYGIVGGPSHGTLSAIDPDTHVVTYTPSANWNGTDSFTFKVNDGQEDSNTATITITVKPVGDNVHLSVAKYLLADGQDSCTVSVSVVDDNGNPQPDTAVTLSTTGGTLADTALTTDANGAASTTLTSSTTTGPVTVTASIEDDADEQTVTFFTFELQVSGATAVPDTTPPMYAVGLGKEDEVITISLITTPDINLADASVGLSWEGGDGTENDSRTVAKDASGQTSVSATLQGSEQSVEIVVIEITGITADSTPLSISDDDPYSPDTKHAVTTWTATPNTKAVLKATITPDVESVHALYNQLLVWSGGQAGETPDKRTVSRNTPSKTDISVKCGESGDAVTAWVAKVNIDIAGVSDSDEDTEAATIYPNTDDDNFTATADPPYNGSDLNESPVDGEDDLVPITITVEPAGIGGTLSLTHGSKVALYRNADKSGTLPSSLTWNLSTRLDDNPSNDDTPPAQLWVEGREISTQLGDQEFTLTHTWGVSSDDTVTATVQAREGESEATVRVVSAATDGQGRLIPGLEKYDPIGGKMYLALQIKLGPGERLDQSMSSVTVKAQDDYAYTGNPAAFTCTWNLGSVSQWWELINPGTAQAQWVPATDAPNNATGNRDGSVAKVYCKLAEWNTPFTPSLPYTPPMGHNGAHTLKIIKVNGVDGDEVSFQHYVVPDWQAAYAKTVPAQKAVVKNLVITNVSTSNGTADYFKYDPAEDGAYHRPTINFTIEDDGDPHRYECYVWIQRTAAASGWAILNHGTAGVDGWMKKDLTSPGSVSATWDGSHEPANWAGHNPDEALWGTYTFDVYAIEYDELGNRKDWFYLKWPYCLTVGDHNLWDNHIFDTEGRIISTELRCDYTLEDIVADPNNEYTNFVLPSGVYLLLVDDQLNVRNPFEQDDDPNAIGYHDGDGDGILLFDSNSLHPYVDWRVLIIGEDNCWVEYRRDHETTLMLAVNQCEDNAIVSYFKDVGGVFVGYGRALNPVRATESLGTMCGYLDGQGWDNAEAWKNIGKGAIDGLKFWEAQTPEDFGERFGGDLLLVLSVAAPFAKAPPKITPIAQDLSAIAVDAAKKIPGRGNVRGIKVHTLMRQMVSQKYPPSKIVPEIAFYRGQRVFPGDPNYIRAVRIDYGIIGPNGQCVVFYDLKTGSATLTPARIQQLRSHMPPQYQQTPILEIHVQ